MSLHVAFVDQAPFPEISSGTHALWRYRVTLDESVTDGRLALGLTTLVDIRDPVQFPAVADLQGTTLVKPAGGVQFVTVDVAQAVNGELEIVFAAPVGGESFAPITLVAMAGALGTPQMLPFRTEPGGMENTTQVIYGPAAAWAVLNPTPPGVDPTPPGGIAPTILPYASEPFGVYQPLIGWRSALSQEKLSSAISRRFRRAARMIGDAASLSARKPIGSISVTSSTDRTSTAIGSQLAAYVSNARSSSRSLDWKAILADSADSPLAAAAHKAIAELQKSGDAGLPATIAGPLSAAALRLPQSPPRTIGSRARPLPPRCCTIWDRPHRTPSNIYSKGRWNPGSAPWQRWTGSLGTIWRGQRTSRRSASYICSASISSNSARSSGRQWAMFGLALAALSS